MGDSGSRWERAEPGPGFGDGRGSNTLLNDPKETTERGRTASFTLGIPPSTPAEPLRGLPAAPQSLFPTKPPIAPALPGQAGQCHRAGPRWAIPGESRTRLSGGAGLRLDLARRQKTPSGFWGGQAADSSGLVSQPGTQAYSALLLASCVASDKSLYLSEPQLPHLPHDKNPCLGSHAVSVHRR